MWEAINLSSRSTIMRNDRFNHVTTAHPSYFRYVRTNGKRVYTTNPNEGAALIAAGARDEGVLCYIWPHTIPAPYSKLYLEGGKGGDFS